MTTQPLKPDENDAPDTAQELLEHHDLQNAQIDSMMHVWDNPEDEVWNDPSGRAVPQARGSRLLFA